MTRYSAALAALVEPVAEAVTRDLLPTRIRLAELAVQHVGHVRLLRARLRLAGAKNDAIGAERVVCALQQAGDRYRARKTALSTATATAPSLLDQLDDAIHSASGHGNASRGVHRSPLNAAAAELRAVIRRGVPVHVGPLRVDDDRLRHDLRCWRPDDEVAAAEQLHGWVEAIRELTEAKRVVELDGACPACGERYVWTTEAGERVRRTAVHLVERDPITDSYALCCNPACGDRTPYPRLRLLAAAMRVETALHDRPTVGARTRG